MTNDMTHGNPLKRMLPFALPLMLSSMLQQLYTLFDSMIVGRLLGSDAFAAIASAGYLHTFPVNLIFGATIGYGVSLSHRFGAKDETGFKRFFASSILLSVLLGMVISVLGLIFLHLLLLLVKTPAEFTAYAYRYVFALWTGLIFTALLNVFSAALRAVGDSKTPFYALMASTVINILLDFLLIGALRMNAEGAALATVLSQAAAALWCFRVLKKAQLLPARAHYKPARAIILELLRLGCPHMLSHGVTATGEIFVLSAINRFSVEFIKGITASRRYFSLLNIVGNGLEGALATYVGQNFGAKRFDRIKTGARSCISLGAISAVVIAVLVSVFARPLISLFIPVSESEAIAFGVAALKAESLFLVSLYLLCEFRAAVQGMGNALIPMLSGFMELVLRIAAALAFPRILGASGLYYTDAAAWVPTTVFLILSYFFILRKTLKQP